MIKLCAHRLNNMSELGGSLRATLNYEISGYIYNNASVVNLICIPARETAGIMATT